MHIHTLPTQTKTRQLPYLLTNMNCLHIAYSLTKTCQLPYLVTKMNCLPVGRLTVRGPWLAWWKHVRLHTSGRGGHCPTQRSPRGPPPANPQAAAQPRSWSASPWLGPTCCCPANNGTSMLFQCPLRSGHHQSGPKCMLLSPTWHQLHTQSSL